MLTCSGPHFKRDYLVQVKVNLMLAAELERETNNEAGTSNLNSLALVEDKDDGQDMILARNPNRIR